MRWNSCIGSNPWAGIARPRGSGVVIAPNGAGVEARAIASLAALDLAFDGGFALGGVLVQLGRRRLLVGLGQERVALVPVLDGDGDARIFGRLGGRGRRCRKIEEGNRQI